MKIPFAGGSSRESSLQNLCKGRRCHCLPCDVDIPLTIFNHFLQLLKHNFLPDFQFFVRSNFNLLS
jgi:hypothetical protein